MDLSHQPSFSRTDRGGSGPSVSRQDVVGLSDGERNLLIALFFQNGNRCRRVRSKR